MHSTFAKSMLLLAVLLLLSPMSPQAWSDEPLMSVTRPGHGQPVCGLGRDFHAGRREALRNSLGKGVVVLRGMPPSRKWARFYQDKTFWYFTGIDSPNVAVIIDATRGEDVLLLPRRDPVKERWEGEKWDIEDPWVSELSGFTIIRPLDDMLEELQARVGGDSPLYVSLLPYTLQKGSNDVASMSLHRQIADPFDGRASREATFKERLSDSLNVDVHDVSGHIAELRLIKQPEEIEAMRRASDVGAAAIMQAMRSTAPARGEWELEAVMDLTFARMGAAGPAYGAIVGSGPNSCVLHHFSSSRTMRDGDILLLDYGPEFDFYTTDITRTWPVNGRFSPRQAELYDIVLEAQLAGIAAAQPGKSIRDVYQAISDVFVRHEVTDLVLHGPCHLIGLDVHDVGTLGRLKPGMTFTIEPGLYSVPEDLGIRIEDVILITQNGNEVLSDAAPKDRSAIEATIAEQGLLR